MLDYLMVMVTANTILLAALIFCIKQGVGILMNEQQKLDAIRDFLNGPLTDYIAGLKANQKDPQDAAAAAARQAEEDQILSKIQSLLSPPATGGTAGASAIGTADIGADTGGAAVSSGSAAQPTVAAASAVPDAAAQGEPPPDKAA